MGEIILNFGNTVVEIGEKELDLYRYTQVNEGCNITCGRYCFDPTAEDNYFMNSECMSGCGCYFSLSNTTSEELWTSISEFEDALMEGADTYSQIFQDVLAEIEPTLEVFRSGKAELETEYAEMVLYHAIETFGCNADCSIWCTDLEFFYPLEMVPCLAQCECTTSPVEVVPTGSEDYGYLKE
mmetsp:Transcript_3264/g.2212  ORF Transcript_3264/g.2212 Transcript_3264/m.2212 type:complete len:183 (-) Transcript_3264:97-645(-)